MDKKTPYYEVMKNRFCVLVAVTKPELLKLLDDPVYLSKISKYLEEIRLIQVPKERKQSNENG